MVSALVSGVRELARAALVAVGAAIQTLITSLRHTDMVNTPVGYYLHRLKPNMDLLSRQLDALLALAVAGPRYSAAASDNDTVALLDQWLALRRAREKTLALLQTYTALVGVLASSSLAADAAVVDRSVARTADGLAPIRASAPDPGRSVAATLSLLRTLDQLPRITVEASLDHTVARAALRQIWRECSGVHSPIVPFAALAEYLAVTDPSGAILDLDLRPNGILAHRLCCLPDLVTVFQLDEWSASRSWYAALQTARDPSRAAADGVLRASRSGSVGGVPGGVGGGQSLAASLAEARSEVAFGASGTTAPSAASSEMAATAALPLEAIVPGSLQHLPTLRAVLQRVHEQLDVVDELLGDAHTRQEDLVEAASRLVPTDHVARVVNAIDRDAWTRAATDYERRQMLVRLAQDLYVREAELDEERANEEKLQRYDKIAKYRGASSGRA